MTAWEASEELHLFPVKVREYRKPDDECNAELIEFFKTYPQKQSNFPEGVITSKPMIHKERDVECVDRIILFFEDCLDQYKERFKLVTLLRFKTIFSQDPNLWDAPRSSFQNETFSS